MRARHACEQFADPLSRQHHWNALGPLRADHAAQPRQANVENVAVQEQQGRQGLVLRRRRDLAVQGQGDHEALNLRRPQVARVEPYEPPDRVQVGLLGAVTVVPGPDTVADHLQEARGTGGGGGGSRRGGRRGCCAAMRVLDHVDLQAKLELALLTLLNGRKQRNTTGQLSPPIRS